MKKIFYKITTKGISICISLLGLSLLIIGSIKLKTPYPWWEKWGENLANSIGGVLISTGIISLFLEISSIQNSVSNAIKGLFCGDIDFKRYTKDELV